MKLTLNFFSIIWMICLTSIVFGQGLHSPNDFLPHEYGKRFTPHSLLVDYFEYVASSSGQVELKEYGRTNELRPLIYAVVSSKANMENLEAIRINNLRRTGLVEGHIDPTLDKAIVWLSYSVHGNEAAGSESSMAVLYELISGQSADIEKWLENTIVIIDPSLNPDGYFRYTHWNNRVSAEPFNAHPDAAEHDEPWPGGRTNHYYFDLNRDWAWQTQKESQARLMLYHQWMPHVHADLHEMGANSPYYFAPAAQPYHTFITDFQSDFQVNIGKNHARYFDQNGWRYFTKEVFDLLYPSYGDTYPTFNGAIGMTYEQGGSGRAGRAIALVHGDTLTLEDRIAHHKTTSLSTIEIAALNQEQLVKEFGSYFQMAQNNPPGEYKSYVISSDNSQGTVQRLLALLDKQKIKYGFAGNSKSLKGFDYLKGESGSYEMKPNDIVISAYQPKGVLLQVLFDPEPIVVDSLTYDITSWALPFAYGLKAFATKEKIEPSAPYQKMDGTKSLKLNAYAYILEWDGVGAAQYLARATNAGILGRVARLPFTIEGKSFDSGSVIFTRADNRKVKDFSQKILQFSKSSLASITPVQTGFVESGKDLGSSSYRMIRNPKVLTIMGDGVSSNSVGQIWHFCETELKIPITLVSPDDLRNVEWSDFTTLVLPTGRYSIDTNVKEKMIEWVSDGGQIIAIGSAVNHFADQDGFALKRYAKDADKSSEEEKQKATSFDNRLNVYANGQRESAAYNVPGAVFRTSVDHTHPLAFGLGDHYFTLKTGSAHFDYMVGGDNVIYLEEGFKYFGFTGAKALDRLKETVVFGTENKGRGNITYMIDNPLFRSFWEQGKLVFSNALFFAGR